MTFWMETLVILKKLLKIFVEKSLNYEIIPIELFVDMKNLKKFVKVAHRTMLEYLIIVNVYF